MEVEIVEQIQTREKVIEDDSQWSDMEMQEEFI